MSLRDYKRKRHFTATPEPAGAADEPSRRARGPSAIEHLHFVVQKHHARTLHYDFRLEWRGVLLSWAVPKGVPTDPSEKRLAVRVEDHPLEYRNFEGRIPEGEYGAGTVEIWDKGEWRPDDPDVDAALRRGELAFTLKGERLKGEWVLVRTRLGAARGQDTWLLIKRKETAAAPRASGRAGVRRDGAAPRRPSSPGRRVR